MYLNTKNCLTPNFTKMVVLFNLVNKVNRMQNINWIKNDPAFNIIYFVICTISSDFSDIFYNFQIYFDNNDHDGQMLIDLDIVAKVLDCEDDITVAESAESKPTVNPLRTVVNVLTILVCSVSFVLCFRALYRAQFLRSVSNLLILF